MKESLKLALINSAIAFGLTFFGAFVDGHITWTSLIASVAASAVVFFMRLKDYYGKIEGKKAMSKGGLFQFI